MAVREFVCECMGDDDAVELVWMVELLLRQDLRDVEATGIEGNRKEAVWLKEAEVLARTVKVR